MKSTNPKDEAAKTRTPMHLLPPPALRPIAHVFGHGAKKYGEHNWRDTSVAMTVYLAAALRHLAALMDGETMDPDSGLPHAAHVAAGMMIILDAEHNGTLIDDRNKTKEWRTESCMDDVSRKAEDLGLCGHPHRGSEFKAEEFGVNPDYRDAPYEAVRGEFRDGDFVVWVETDSEKSDNPA